jgi:hypothetical protein
VPDYFDNCRWKTQNVAVTGNTFNFTPADITGCAGNAGCGYTGLFASYGTKAPYTQATVPNNVAFNQNDRFTANSYTGPWRFDAWNQGNHVTQAQWQAPVTDRCLSAGEQQSGACTSGFGQDTGSTFN